MSSHPKYNKLANSYILIIGGSSGIGYCVAEACLEQGAHVTISSSQPTRISTAIDKLRSTYADVMTKLEGYACDLGAPATLERNLATLFAKLDAPLDHIIYTAGDAVPSISLQDVTVESMQQAGTVRFFAPMMVAKIGIKHLNPGPASSITFTSGYVSQKPVLGWSIPAAYAAGLDGMMRNLALDLKPVRVNVVSPGPVMTELWDPVPKAMKDGVWNAMAERHLTGKMGRPEDVAEAYLYLMKDWNCTGSVIGTHSGGLLV